MTPERKQEIKRLHAAASPGPWTYDETVGDVYAEKTDEIICSDVKNAPFIAASITVVPELMASLEEAEQTIVRQRRALEFYANSMCIQKEDLGWNVGFIAREALRVLGPGVKEGEKTDA